MSKVKKDYKYVDPKTLVRSHRHAATFADYDADQHAGTMESYADFTRINPVTVVEELHDGEVRDAYIEGGKAVRYAIENGIDKIFVCKVELEDESEVTRLMIELQVSNHNSLPSLFMMIMQLWPLYEKGQGFRSDLKSEGEGTEEQKSDKIYDKIGRILKISGNKVKLIRKVGMVNPLYFGRIENSRFTLYQAYQECVKQERGEMPEPPSVNAPNWISTATPTPEFTEDATNDTSDYDAEGEADSDNEAHEDNKQEHPVSTELFDGVVEPEKEIPSVYLTDKHIRVRGYCTCCHKEAEVIISKPETNE